MSALKLTKFCCGFTLRQGTILIAIIELTLTAFCLFLMLLCATHSLDIVDLVTSELQRLEEYSFFEGGVKESTPYLIKNEKKMLDGQHMALVIMFIVWAGLLSSTIHFVSCILLLYGAIRRHPNLLIPWTSTAFFSLLLSFSFLAGMIFLPLRTCKFGAILILICFHLLATYFWLTVFSYYRDLKTRQLKGFAGVIHKVVESEKLVHVSHTI